jgi:hypothetical protein
VLVIADTPLFPKNVPGCLTFHPQDVGACEVPRSAGIRLDHDRLESVTAAAHGAAFASMNPWVCPAMLCPAVVGHRVLWRDRHHMTATYSRQLAPAFGALVVAALQVNP